MANTATAMYFAGGTNDPDYISATEANGGLEASGQGSMRFGSSAWTVEAWVYPLAVSSDGFSTIWNLDGVASEYCDFGYISSNLQVYLRVGDGTNTGWWGALSPAISTFGMNKWHHLALSRVGSYFYIWLNGSLAASTSATVGDGLYNWNECFLGSGGGNYYHNNGYIDQFRVSHGTRYGNIDVPTTQLKTWQTAGRGQNTLLPHHTKLLIQANSSTTTSSAIVDETGNHTITVTNNVTHSQGKTLFGNTAIYFDGTDDKLTIAANPAHAIAASEDYSVEFWVYHATALSGQNNQYWINNDNDWAWKSYNHTSQDWFQLILDSTTIVQAPFNSAGGWTHAAVGRVNNVHCAWINGNLGAANTATSGDNIDIAIPSSALYMGAMSGNAQDCHGYLDNIRICVGQSAYTPHFSPYGSQKNVTVSRGGAVTDARHPSANTHAIRMGQAAIGSTAATNANTYCLDFDGTADYLINNIPSWRSSDDRGTLFAWVYFDVVNAAGTIFASSDADGGGSHYDWIHWRIDGNGKLDFTKRSNDGTGNSPGGTSLSSSALSAGQWYSVAVVADGTNPWLLYVDGAAISMSTAGASGENGHWLSDLGSTNNIAIGAHSYASGTSVGDYLNGKVMQIAYWGGASGTTGVLDADAIAALHAAGKGYDIKGSGNTGNYDSWADDLKGYWQMGNHYLDTAGNAVIHDASGNGVDMASVSAPLAKTWTTGTTFLEGWQDRGFFTGDKYTALLIQSAHANGSTTFTDSGPGFKRTYFDGTADYAHAAVANYRSSDTEGTIVCWFKCGDVTFDVFFCSNDTASTTDYAYHGVYEGTLYSEFNASAGYTAYRTNDAVIEAGKWHCVAIVNVRGGGGSTTYYVDGVAVDSYVARELNGKNAWFADVINRDNIVIGAFVRTSAANFIQMQMTQLGVWSSALSAAQISAIAALDLDADWTTSYGTGLVDYWTFGNKITEGTDTSSTIYSQVSGGNDLTGVSLAAPYAGHTVTAAGGAHHNGSVSAASGIFNGSLIYFDGTDDILRVANFEPLGNGAFTLEGWACATDADSGVIFSTRADNSGWGGSGNTTEWQLRMHSQSPPKWTWFEDDGDDTVTENAFSTSYVINQWYHFALVRDTDGSTITLYVDGIPSAPITDSNNYNAVKELQIGGQYTSSSDNIFAGFMDELRISIGIARYTKSIERYANTFVEKGDTGDAFTSLQIQSNGARSGTKYSDGLNRSGTSTTTTTIGGNPEWVTTGGDPFGGANTALHFNGKTDYIGFGDSTDFEPGTGAFTVEWWWKPDNVGTFKTVWTKGGTGYSVDYGGFQCISSSAPSSSGRMIFVHKIPTTGPGSLGNANEIHSITHETSGVAAGKWSHHVIQRGDSHQYFIDGVLISANNSTVAMTDNLTAGSYPFRLGISHDSNLSSCIDGYFEDFRFSKGIARYGDASLRTAQQVVTSSNSDSQVVTANSTGGSGTNAFTTDEYTAFLLQGDGTGFAGTAGDTFSDESASPGLGAKTVTNGTSAVTLIQGFSAFGANSYYFSGASGCKLSVASSSDYAMGKDPFTVETWVYFDAVSADQFLMGTTSGTDNDFDLYVDCSGTDQGPVMYLNDTADRAAVTPEAKLWTHICVQRDSNHVLSFFWNGKRVGVHGGRTENIVADSFALGQQWNNGGRFAGYMDSFRISKGIARYGYTGTNVKVGLNAVHHSHCKLLITSNTFNGNTHFDDFSDQGNYWNQTPYSYYFDGTNRYMTNTTADWRGSDDRGTILAWINPNTIAEEYIFTSNDTAGGDNWFGMYMEQHSGGKLKFQYKSTSPSVTTYGYGDTTVERGIWHAVAVVSDGDDWAFYVDGKAQTFTFQNGTNTGQWLGDNNTRNNFNIGALVRDSTASSKFDGKIAQVAVWGGASGTDGVLSASQINAIWGLGPTADLTTSYSTNLVGYWGMGNHNEVGGRPADTAATVYDRSGNANDLTTAGSMYAPNKGHTIIPSGNIKHSTEVENFGSSAIHFDGSGDGLTTGLSDDFERGTGDWTLEFWLNKSKTQTNTTVVGQELSGGSNGFMIEHTSSKLTLYMYELASGWTVYGQESSIIVVGDWSHYAFTRTAGIHRLYRNGILQSSITGAQAHNPSDNVFRFGIHRSDAARYFTGYMDELGFYSVNKYNSVALPDKATITPSYLTDPSGNHFTVTNFSVTDQMVDTPENNFCTLNPLNTSKQMSGTNFSSMTFTLTEGNTKMSVNGSQWGAVTGTLGVNTGKWYYECNRSSSANHTAGWVKAGFEMIGMSVTGGAGQGFGDVSTADVAMAFKVGTTSTGFLLFDGPTADFTHAEDLPGVSYVGTVGIAIDFDNGKFYASHEGKWLGNQDPVNGLVIDGIAEFVTGTGHWLPMFCMADNGVWQTANFGQGDPDGENNFTDGNGRGGFRFEPPSGFLSLCTANMSDADYAPIGPNSTTGTPDQHFDTVLWRGDGNTGNAQRPIGGLNFQPDLVWMKSRDSTSTHMPLFDTVRGPNKRIGANYTGAEDTQPMCSSFNPDGFSVGDDRNSAENHVAWCWKAGNGTVENSDGDLACTVSANPEAGFSIIGFDNRTADLTNYTLGHGLNKAPEFVLVKNRGKSSQFAAFHKGLTANYYLAIGDSDAQANYSGYFPSGGMTAKTIKLGTDDDVAGQTNGPGIIYAWHSVEGFSKFGSYEGNNNADGPYIYLGFKPALVIVKNIDASEPWTIYDNKRNPYNPCSKGLYTTTAAENSASGRYKDFLSNGFKPRGTSGEQNAAQTYVYMAWAEMPFKYATAR